MDNNYLSHYGVPGMRWGHRRGRRDQQKVTSATKFSELEKYKRDARVKNTVKGVLNGIGFTAATVAVAPAVLMSWGLIRGRV